MNKNYVVIGGSSGIGREVVTILESQGSNVFATYNENSVENRDSVKYQQFNVINDSFDPESLPETIDGLVY